MKKNKIILITLFTVFLLIIISGILYFSGTLNSVVFYNGRTLYCNYASDHDLSCSTEDSLSTSGRDLETDGLILDFNLITQIRNNAIDQVLNIDNILPDCSKKTKNQCETLKVQAIKENYNSSKISISTTYGNYNGICDVYTQICTVNMKGIATIEIQNRKNGINTIKPVITSTVITLKKFSSPVAVSNTPILIDSKGSSKNDISIPESIIVPDSTIVQINPDSTITIIDNNKITTANANTTVTTTTGQVLYTPRKNYTIYIVVGILVFIAVIMISLIVIAKNKRK